MQRLALETVSALSDVPLESIATAVDGCGVVTFGMPIHGLAVAFARLADPSAVADPPLRAALTRIRDAMMAHPELVAGERRRIDTALMRAYPKRVVSKGGAEGVLAMGLPPGALPDAPRSGRTDGHRRQDRGRQPRPPRRRRRGHRVLRQLGLVAEPLPGGLVAFASPPIVDPRGDRSGDVRPAFRLS